MLKFRVQGTQQAQHISVEAQGTRDILVTSLLPMSYVDLPDTMVELPGTMVDLPGTMVDLPDIMVDLPDK